MSAAPPPRRPDGLGRILARRAGKALKALLMPASVLAHAPRVLRHPGLTAGEKARALATLVRIRLARMVWMLGQVFRGEK